MYAYLWSLGAKWHDLIYGIKRPLQLLYGEWIWDGRLTDQLEDHQLGDIQ